ncbi:MAG TPA: GAF and ANTAR domain-containing protein [Nocardioidaceae bacterium]|nr:GAF and ANTAR domain-containing protein [Nocardioidaceae bacterium]
MKTEELVGAFVELADTLVDDFDVVELLQRLTNRCVDLLGASAAGLLLADEHGELRIAVSSSERARLLELYQLQANEGPCLDCYRNGEPVNVPVLATASSRWPRFAPTAVAAGYGGVYAVPMRVRGDVVGALNLFDGVTDSGAIHDALRVAQALTDVAAIALMQGEAVRRRERLAEQLQTALNSRVVVEQAKGLVAGRLDVELEAAFELLRSFARRTNRRLAEVSDDVITGRLEAQALRR